MRFSAAGAALLLSACAGSTSSTRASSAPAPATGNAGDRVRAVADDYFAAWTREFPMSAAFSGVPEAANDRLGDNSLAELRAWRQREDRWLAQLEAIDAGALRGTPDEPTYGILRETLAAARQSRVCHGELWPIDQQNGWQLYLPLLAQIQPLGTPELRARRWRAGGRCRNTSIPRSPICAKASGGVHPAAGERGGGAGANRRDPEAAAGRSPFAAMIATDSTPAFRDSVVALVGTAIVPAVRRYRDYLAAEYIPTPAPRAMSQPAAWRASATARWSAASPLSISARRRCPSWAPNRWRRSRRRCARSPSELRHHRSARAVRPPAKRPHVHVPRPRRGHPRGGAGGGPRQGGDAALVRPAAEGTT